MKTILKCHTAENNYDGYAPHHHWMLLDIDPSVYLLFNQVFPTGNMKAIVLNPWLSQFIRTKVKRVGYDFLELVDPEYRGKGFYAFGDLHDGVDGEPTGLIPSVLIKTLSTAYINGNGVHSTCEVYGVPDSDLLQPNECWVKHPTVNRLVRGIVRNGSSFLSEQKYTDLFPDAQWDQTTKTAYWGEKI